MSQPGSQEDDQKDQEQHKRMFHLANPGDAQQKSEEGKERLRISQF